MSEQPLSGQGGLAVGYQKSVSRATDDKLGGRVKKVFRSAVAMCAAALLIVAGANMANAASASGTVSYFGPYGGYNYKDYSTIYTGTSAQALTNIKKDGNGDVPSGYMGIRSRLFKSDGTLCKSSTVWYGGGSGLEDGTVPPSCGVGSYYSDGWTYAWTGSSYYEHNTKRSPNLTLS